MQLQAQMHWCQRKAPPSAAWAPTFPMALPRSNKDISSVLQSQQSKFLSFPICTKSTGDLRVHTKSTLKTVQGPASVAQLKVEVWGFNVAKKLRYQRQLSLKKCLFLYFLNASTERHTGHRTKELSRQWPCK